jgi:hypothetical protein
MRLFELRLQIADSRRTSASGGKNEQLGQVSNEPNSYSLDLYFYDLGSNFLQP